MSAVIPENEKIVQISVVHVPLEDSSGGHYDIVYGLTDGGRIFQGSAFSGSWRWSPVELPRELYKAAPTRKTPSLF